ncbi:MAG: HEAT repeat domain-containing protein [Nannocystis sp.]|nr:HEAT repeat domain-containing protein [Nannocystis sp.]
MSPPASALALLGDDRIAALCGDELVILARKDGRERQRLPLGERGTAIASDPSRAWIAVGGERGVLFAFDGEAAKVVESERRRVHEGPIQSLLFEPEELRVLSGGVDGRIFLTHVRGALDPEDRSGKNNHAAAVTSLVHGPGDKTYSGGKDGVARVWTRGSGRPSTLKDGVVNVVAAAMAEHSGRPHLALAGEDRTIRLFLVDAAGKPELRALTLHGAVAWAAAELAHRDPKVREAALKELAAWGDSVAIDLLGKSAKGDGDHRLKLLATELLGKSGLARATKPLEELLRAGEEAVRLAAFTGLRGLEGEGSLRPLNLALGARKRDIGVAAIKALAPLAGRDDLALDRLIQALSEDPREVRIAALLALESLHDAASPEADLLALRSTQADIRRLAVIRFYQRGLAARPDALAALRRHAADADASVRQAAFLVSILNKPALAGALRFQDRDIHRLLHELESTPVPTFEASAKGEDNKQAASAPPKAKKVEIGQVGEEDRRPLLEAMASRALDTCLAGATGLASLRDPRALGTLLQLSREGDAKVRVAVCKALQELSDPRGAARLRLLMRDGEASVRDAAFSAIAELERATPLAVAEAGLLAMHEDVRRRGLDLLVRHLKAGKKGAPLDPGAVALLERALGDAARPVRSEAFKAVLSLAVDGGGAASLRFARRSLHADIRKEVLGEVLGQIEAPWAWALLLEIFRDPEPAIRAEAFEFAMKRTRGVGLEPLQAALTGPYADLRVEATKILGKRKAPGIHELLVQAVDDEDEAVRQLAVDALLVNDADEALSAAMASRHPDVVVRAAGARAVHGDPAALAPLLAVITAAEPEIPALAAKWKDRLLKAAEGLVELSEPAARPALIPLLQHKDAAIRQGVARALAWSVRPAEADGVAALMAALQHSDAAVRVEAALGLAYCGDPAGASLLFVSGDARAQT